MVYDDMMYLTLFLLLCHSPNMPAYEGDKTKKDEQSILTLTYTPKKCFHDKANFYDLDFVISYAVSSLSRYFQSGNLPTIFWTSTISKLFEKVLENQYFSQVMKN